MEGMGFVGSKLMMSSGRLCKLILWRASVWGTSFSISVGLGGGWRVLS